MAVPSYDELFNPLLQALKNLGGSASIPEQESEVAKILKLSNKDISDIHRGNRTKLNYRLAWARHYLKRYGILNNSKRGVWSFTSDGLNSDSIAKELVKRFVTAEDHRNRAKSNETKNIEDEQAVESWEDELLGIVKKLNPMLLRDCVSVYYGNQDLFRWRLLDVLGMEASTVKEL